MILARVSPSFVGREVEFVAILDVEPEMGIVAERLGQP